MADYRVFLGVGIERISSLVLAKKFHTDGLGLHSRVGGGVSCSSG